MPKSDLQEPFIKELSECCRATAKRIVSRLESDSEAQASSIIQDELRGLYHGILVVFDGGTSLADRGLIQIVDEDGHSFDRNLHERCFEHWPDEL